MATFDVALRDNGTPTFDVSLAAGGGPSSVLVSQFRSVMQGVVARLFGRVN